MLQIDVRGMLSGLEEASRRPVGESAGVDAVQLARDVFLSEQEFRRSGEYLSGERAVVEGRGRGLEDFLKGVGWGAVGLMGVVPVGKLGKAGKVGDLGRALGLGEDVAGVRAASRASVRVPQEPVAAVESSRLQPSLLRPEGGVFTSDLSGVRVRELAETMVQRQVDSPLGLAALSPQEIGDSLRSVPEFKNFLRVYRDAMSRDPETLARYSGAPQVSLLEYARRTGRAAPGSSFQSSLKSPELSLDISLGRGGLVQAANNLGARVGNASMWLTDDAFSPSFYIEFNRVLRSVSEQTGLPVLTLSEALAAASSRAAPYDELLRLRRAAPFVKTRNGVATFPSVEEIRALGPGGHPLWAADKANPDTFVIAAGRALAEAVNNPDLTRKISGISSKTLPYAYLRYDPGYAFGYVADTVDGLGQFLIRGTEIATSDALLAVQNQFAGRILAEIYGIPPSQVQEAIWAYIRLARDAFVPNAKTGKLDRKAIGSAFSGSAGSAEQVLLDAVGAMGDDVVQLARRNYDAFEGAARSGDLPGWVWDSNRNTPVLAGAEFLIPETARKTPRVPQVQAAMLEAVEAAGPVLREHVLALAAAMGIPAALLWEAMGESAKDVPEEVIDA